MHSFSKIYNTSLALLTDLYQLTMAQGYFRLGMQNTMSCFHLFFRKKPFGGNYAIATGIGPILEFIENFRYEASDLDYLRQLSSSDGTPLFQQDFLDYLKNLKFSCDVDAVEEGSVVFPYEPLVRIKGPLLQAQLLETPLLNLFNFQTLIATKASRICLASCPDTVVEFGVRRAQGIDGGISATRASFIGGCHLTSNVIGGKLFGIPVSGTQAHSWVMAFDTEEEAFENFAKVAPKQCVFLVDTYDTVEGIKKAIHIAKKIQKQGTKLLGIRLDSGDLAGLSITARSLLDEAGMQDVNIMATNTLDELVIKDLKQQGAKINMWGVGTHLVTGEDQPALDGVYKLAALQDKSGKWQHKLKISDSISKVTDPGILQVRRFFSPEGVALYDVIYDELGEMHPLRAIETLDPSCIQKIDPTLKNEDLLIPMIRLGKVIYKTPPLVQMRERTYDQLKKFSPGVLRFLNPHRYFVGLESSLYEKKLNIIKEIKRS